jgi:hypothetical protein
MTTPNEAIELEEARALLSHYRQRHHQMMDNSSFQNRLITTVRQEKEDAIQTLARVLEALKPFAVYAESLPKLTPKGEVTRATDAGPALTASVGVDKDYVITFADLRKAKTVFDAAKKVTG